MRQHMMTIVFILFYLPLHTVSAQKYETIPYDEFRKTGGTSYVRLADGWTNYELSGDSACSPIAVLIHGGTIPQCIWNAQMEELHTAGFRTLRYDQYGRGYSDRPATVYSRDLFLRQLKELLDSLEIKDPVSIIGPSFGGAIAVNFASQYPERVKNLILISPALDLINSDSPLAGYIKLLRIPCLGECLYHTFVRTRMLRRGRSLVPGGNGSACDSTFVNQFACKGTAKSFFSMFRSDAYGDYRKETRKVNRNVKNIMLIRGMEDKDVTEKMIGNIRNDLPGAAFIEIEKSGHNPGSDAAKVFNALIIDYLQHR